MSGRHPILFTTCRVTNQTHDLEAVSLVITDILHTSKKLRNNKSPGEDEVLNESTFQLLIIFVSLKSLDIFFKNKQKLFCAFVDYQKAFDTVWRFFL